MTKDSIFFTFQDLSASANLKGSRMALLLDLDINF